MNHLAVIISKYLNLDVARVLDVPFKVNTAILECGVGLGSRCLIRPAHFRTAARYAHSASAASCGRFYQHGVANAVRFAKGLFLVVDGSITSRRNRNTCGRHREL